jgi:hypothetical protein
MYQGHHADGSSVQRHSAGDLYPYVVACRQQGDSLVWFLIGPGLPDRGSAPFARSEDAVYAARRLLAVREVEDAWSFELGRLCRVSGQTLPLMREEAAALPIPKRWADMSRTQRVDALVRLGAWRARVWPTWVLPSVFEELGRGVAQ